MENTVDNSREYMYIFKEQFDYLDILTDSQFANLFRMIRDLRFNGKDIKVKDIDDVTLKGIWVSLRPQILKSARNARHHKNRPEIADATPTNEPVETTPILPNVEIDERVPAEKKDIKLKFLLRNFAKYGMETERFLKQYADERHSKEEWNAIIKAWVPEEKGRLLPEPIIHFLRAVYKKATQSGDNETDKMLQPQTLEYNPTTYQLLLTCPQECLSYWQRNITPSELETLGKGTSVKFEVLR